MLPTDVPPFDSNLIKDSTWVGIVSVGISFTYAVFITASVISDKTSTSKVISSLSPDFTVNSIPSFNFSSVYSVSSPFNLIVLFSTSFVPVGIVSFTVAVPSASPMFSMLIV